MSSGPREVFDLVAPLLRDIGPNLVHVGAGEQARIMKLALNLMIGGTTQLLAEALVLAERHGLERATVLEVISGSVIGSPYVNYKRETLLSGDYTSTFTARLLYKDLASPSRRATRHGSRCLSPPSTATDAGVHSRRHGRPRPGGAGAPPEQEAGVRARDDSSTTT